jgi:hypothetical protein
MMCQINQKYFITPLFISVFLHYGILLSWNFFVLSAWKLHVNRLYNPTEDSSS